MRAARLCIVVGLLTTARIAWGAGFDCAKASTTVEKKICADGQLSELDGRLAEWTSSNS